METTEGVKHAPGSTAGENWAEGHSGTREKTNSTGAAMERARERLNRAAMVEGKAYADGGGVGPLQRDGCEMGFLYRQDVHWDVTCDHCSFGG